MAMEHIGSKIASENLVKEELNFFVKKYKPKKLCVAGGCA